jgi:tRNA (adenine37-N6)-methyltransferase
LPSLTLEPIGFVRTEFTTRVEAPRQPGVNAESEGRIELLPGHHFEHALEDLQGWDRIWVIYWFHHNQGWRPKVLPPRSTTGRKGVFATRAPHRPNPLGLSAVRLVGVQGLTLMLRGVDMLDGTPVLDIKPYVAYTDAFADAGTGWLGIPDGTVDPRPDRPVEFTALAESQLTWVAEHSGFALRERLRDTLRLGSQPHPYRRIKHSADGMRIAVRDWRADFEVHGGVIRVLRIYSGYRESQLLAGAAPNSSTLALHREFLSRFAGVGP